MCTYSLIKKKLCFKNIHPSVRVESGLCNMNYYANNSTFDFTNNITASPMHGHAHLTKSLFYQLLQHSYRWDFEEFRSDLILILFSVTWCNSALPSLGQTRWSKYLERVWCQPNHWWNIFAPLLEWLRQQNEGHPVGWTDECPPGSVTPWTRRKNILHFMSKTKTWVVILESISTKGTEINIKVFCWESNHVIS